MANDKQTEIEALKENNAWFTVAIEGTTDTSLGATTLTEAIRVSKETRAKMPHLRELTILENGSTVWREQLPFSIEEARKTNILLTGQSNCGKTKWCAYLASLLRHAGFQVIIVDNVSVWKDVSDIPTWIHQKETSISTLPSQSVIYDISEMLIDDQQLFVDNLCAKLWDQRLNAIWTQPIMVFLEEAEIYARNLKSHVAQNVFRLAMSARNLGIRMGYVTPRISNIATELIELSGQRYHGFCNEDNSLQKINAMYGKEWRETIKKLGVGEFIYVNGKEEPRKVKIPEFKTQAKPKQIVMPKPVATASTVQATLQYGNVETRIGQLITWIAWFLFMAWLMLR